MTLRKNLRFYKKVALHLALLLWIQAIMPVSAWALTSGPTQPEFNSFEPVGTTQMVDLFSGEFTYNIPLFDLPGPNGGYPFNLSYKPEGNVDAESGPFGLGWNINPGVIKRDVRGIPDDADGDLVKTKMSIKDNWTAGLTFAPIGAELFGLFSLSTPASIFYNSYKGVGYSIDFSIGNHKSAGLDIGLNFSLNSQEGFGLTPSIGIGDKLKFSASTTIGSRTGMSGLALSLKKSLESDVEDAKGNKIGTKHFKTGIGVGTTISFADRAHTPSVSMPWNGGSANVQVKLGASFLGIFPNTSVGGFFNYQKIAKDGKTVETPAYGYLNMHKADPNESDEKYLLDFTHEKDGPVRDKSPSMGLPSTTPDIYTAVGQGIGGMFRPYRSDVGVLFDKETNSFMGGGSFKADAPVFKVGFEGNGNFTIRESGKWKNNNSIIGDYDFYNPDPNGDHLYEPYYFKVQGETVSEDKDAISEFVGGEQPMRIDIGDGSAANSFLTKDGTRYSTSGNTSSNTHKLLKDIRDVRKSRNNSILPVKNSDLVNMGVFNIDHFNGTNFQSPSTNPVSLSRNDDLRKSHHIGGIIAYNPNGLRYVYGLPAYNKKQVEYAYSVDGAGSDCGPILPVDVSGSEVDHKVNGTDKYLKRTETPAYAHSYLLTSVLGTDYIDRTDNGPSADDHGYWVDFTYSKIHDDYKWRVPYHGAFFDKGLFAKPQDDKASFTYGEKEIWMLGKVETKTHIAVFHFLNRNDGKEANDIFANSGMGSKGLHKIDKIEVFTRLAYETNGKPMKTIHFELTDELCSGTLNSSSNKKLTLKKVWFTYENSDRGEFSPYKFDYQELPVGDTYDPNPGYHPTAHDRWGTYKDNSSDPCGNIDFPYTEQFDDSATPNPAAFLEKKKRNASAWHLRKITLPSGADIKIEWEPKTYGHVQDRIATQMFRIKSLCDGGTNSNKLYGNGACTTNGNRVYFQLEEPLNDPAGIEPYFEDFHINPTSGKKQLYYRMKVKLRSNPSGGGTQDEYIAGYADIESYGVDGTAPYTRGYVELADTKIGSNVINNHHPISIASWQFMKINMPDLAFAVGNMPTNSTPSGKAGIIEVVSSLLAPLNDILSMFQGYYDYSAGKDLAREIYLDKSFIRLNSPDKEKFGGGARVRKIQLVDDWDPIDQNTYGQVYDYEDGVATFEPGIGGDENALRHAQYFPESIPLSTDNNLFFEYPVNERLYPGPSIGYGKVTVRSMATYLDNPEDMARPSTLPAGISTTGKVVNEFYTAKDFPVITDQTTLKKILDKDNASFFPFITITEESLTASQGGMIIKNNMHGKQKQISRYAQDANGDFIDAPYNWVRYNYHQDEKTVDNRPVKVLDNVVNVLKSNDPIFNQVENYHELPQEPRLVGVDYELVTGMRNNYAFSMDIGAKVDMDVIVIPFIFPIIIPVPTVWPNSAIAETRVRTASTNKIINKTGILKSVEAYDGGSLVTTENKLFDGQTGQSILTVVNNNFDEPVYNHKLQAYYEYDGMGPAYKNLGMRFNGTVTYNGACGLYEVTIPSGASPHLVEGDEFILSEDVGSDDPIYNDGEATFIKRQGFTYLFDVQGFGGGSSYAFNLTRSGRRNMVSTTISTISALSDPTIGITANNTCQVDLDLFGTQQGSVFIIEQECASKDIALLNLLLSTDTDGDGLVDFYDGIPFDPIEFNNAPYAATYASLVAEVNVCRDNPGFDIVAYWYSEISDDPFVQNETGSGSHILGANPGNTFPGCPNVPLSGDLPMTNLTHFSNLRTCGGLSTNFLIDFNYENSSVATGKSQTILGDVPIVPLTGTIVVEADETIDVLYNTVNDILSIDATTYSDAWEIEDEVLLAGLASPAPRVSIFNNPYRSGKRGVWRPEATYAYVDQRNQTGNGDVSNLLNLRVDGDMDNVVLFNWQDPFLVDCDNSWQRTNYKSMYTADNELENKDPLNNYTAALHGYEDNLATAVGSNARSLEIGFEGFEEFEANKSIQQLGADGVRQSGHIDIIPTPGATILTNESYEILSGKGNVFTIDRPYNALWETPSYMTMIIKLRSGEELLLNPNVDVNATAEAPDGNTVLVVNYSSGCGPELPSGGSFDDEIWKGKVYLPDYFSNPGLSEGSARIVNNMAHTGKNSLRIPRSVKTSTSLNTLRLEPGKDYIFSAWIRRDYMHPKNATGVKINSQAVLGMDKIINNWQRIELTFKASFTGETTLSFNTGPVLEYVDDGRVALTQSDLYIDDMRIHPADGNLQTHVYDPNNYRLVATLDENNFATIYDYNQEGELIITRKETEEGIMTLKHNELYVKEHDQ